MLWKNLLRVHVKIEFFTSHEPVNSMIYLRNTSVEGQSDCGTDESALCSQPYVDSAGRIVLRLCLLLCISFLSLGIGKRHIGQYFNRKPPLLRFCKKFDSQNIVAPITNWILVPLTWLHASVTLELQLGNQFGADQRALRGDFKVGSHEGTCCRNMSRGRISYAVHTKGLAAGIGFLKFSHGGSCRRDMSWFRFLILVYFPECRGDVSHEQFTRGDLAFNRGVTSPRHVPATCPLVWADL